MALPENQDAALWLALSRAGHRPEWLPPAVLDHLRWRWRRAWLDGRDKPALWQTTERGLPARLAAAGPPPDGWAPHQDSAHPTRAPYRAREPGPWSKRRRLGQAGGGQAAPARAAVPPDLEPLSPADHARAVRACAEHGPAQRDLLRLVVSEDARLRLMLALDRLNAGELDHWQWMDAVAALRGR
ncbi:hypothetical protein [Roseomonas sp. BN140053]|uniref:hypothetical protein n=1 Tax=Roseomonas sp. BN140053 TaxID=3391898 RepID=UPI0039E86A86